MAKAIPIDRTSLSALCQRHHIQVPGFLALYELETELSKLLGGRKVDLVTQRSLNRRLRDRVLASAEVEYAAG